MAQRSPPKTKLNETQPNRDPGPNQMVLFSFPADAHWNAKRNAIEFGVGLGDYQGVVRVDQRVFRHLIGAPATPAKCIELDHLQRIDFERAAEEKLRRRELADDRNIELTGRDLRRVIRGFR
jgi:hypothetical protein